jgi:hypothetical protein
VNDDIDRLRHSATRALLERRDTIVVASVSCIYGLGMPAKFIDAALRFSVGFRPWRASLGAHSSEQEREVVADVVGALEAMAYQRMDDHDRLMAVAWGGELRRNEVAGRIVLELQQRRNSWICAR